MEQRVAIRYAQALMDLAVEGSLVDRLSTDVQVVEDALESSRELRALLSSPVVREHVKLSIMTQIFESRVSKQMLDFMRLLLSKGRGELLHAIAVEFQKLVDRQRGVVRAKVESAVALSNDQQRIIGERLTAITGRTVIASYSLNPALKGGFVARIGDTLIDASLSHQLEILREQFRKGGSPALN